MACKFPAEWFDVNLWKTEGGGMAVEEDCCRNLPSPLPRDDSTLSLTKG